jgi:hypothetical protein
MQVLITDFFGAVKTVSPTKRPYQLRPRLAARNATTTRSADATEQRVCASAPKDAPASARQSRRFALRPVRPTAVGRQDRADRSTTWHRCGGTAAKLSPRSPFPALIRVSSSQDSETGVESPWLVLFLCGLGGLVTLSFI